MTDPIDPFAVALLVTDALDALGIANTIRTGSGGTSWPLFVFRVHDWTEHMRRGASILEVSDLLERLLGEGPTS